MEAVIAATLKPLLIAAYGRSGTTALMALLGHSPRVALGREYPYEDRCLSFFVKSALVLDRHIEASSLTQEQLCDFNDRSLGRSPPLGLKAGLPDPSGIAVSAIPEVLALLWRRFSAEVAQASPHATIYAEKVACWLPAFLRACLPVQTIYLFRDPRDMFISANAFMRKHNYYSFGRSAGDSDLDHAHNLAHDFLSYFENYRADRQRSDCLLLDYSDLILDRAHFAKRLSDFLGTEVTAGPIPWPDRHRTASSLEATVSRWKQESLSTPVLQFLETNLQEAMASLGFEQSGSGRRHCPASSFLPCRIESLPFPARHIVI
ncbi:MAG TPA: sulfotransferase domain-containing protein [Gemmataceae bacterium]|jgi:hypothetical protein|nr:sulfotransferase domain-containing protein [Gemmataceae bacterium]